MRRRVHGKAAASRAAAVAVAVAVAVAGVTGCGSSKTVGERAADERRAVERAVERHWQALRRRSVVDYCSSLFPAELTGIGRPAHQPYREFLERCGDDLAGWIRAVPARSLPRGIRRVARIETGRRPNGATGTATVELLPRAGVRSPSTLDLVRFDGEWRVVLDAS